jgi:hypothetical protein
MNKTTARQSASPWLPLVLILVLAAGCDGDPPADDDDITDDDDDATDDDDDDATGDDDDTATAPIEWVDSIENHGVTWTFAEQAQAGQFITGDWFVLGPVTWGPYEHLPPEQWVSSTGESYRRCCTSLSWVGQALAARLVGATEQWDHDAWFDYVDRWMDPTGDDAYTQEILARTGWDYTADWAAHGQAWDDLVEQMWAQYR